jgi:hypothetical protein
VKGEGVFIEEEYGGQSKSTFKRENVNFELPTKFNLLRTYK